MAAEREAVTSDTESHEKPVREQLKKTRITRSGAGDASVADEEVVEPSEENGTHDPSESRGRLHRKRSFEEVESEGQTQDPSSDNNAKGHTRKRSRDSTAEEAELNNGQRKSGERAREVVGAEEPSSTSNGDAAGAPVVERASTPEQTGPKRGEASVEEMTSPKTKRTRVQSATEKNGTATTSEAPESAQTASEPPPQEARPATKIPPSSAFSNTSASSPFASLSAGSKSPSADPPQTSSGAFAASGFGSLSASSTSGFGAIGQKSGGFGSGGGFGTNTSSITATAPATTKEEDKPVKTTAAAASSTTFGGTLGQKSAFSTSASGPASSGGSAFGASLSTFGSTPFGGTSSGFGSLGAGAGTGLSTFASGKPSSSSFGSSSSKPAKAFGAPADEDEEPGDGEGDREDDADESGFRSPLSQESDKQDERFYAQSLETGEEDETVEFSCRAKLYCFATLVDGKKEWKERGLGVVRLNVKRKDDGEGETKKARLLMRADGSHRVILNTPVKKEIKFGDPAGELPKGGYMYFMGTVDGRAGLESLLLKVGDI